MGRTRRPSGEQQDGGAAAPAAASSSSRSKRRRFGGSSSNSNSSSSSAAWLDILGTGQGGMYHCNYCQRDITGEIHIKCAECVDCDLCLDCFSVGAYLHPHRPDHPYRIMENLSFPLFHPDWSAEEELLLLEAIGMYGLGNWTEISEHVGTGKSAEQCHTHYLKDYLASPCAPLPDMRKLLTSPGDRRSWKPTAVIKHPHQQQQQQQQIGDVQAKDGDDGCAVRVKEEQNTVVPTDDATPSSTGVKRPRQVGEESEDHKPDPQSSKQLLQHGSRSIGHSQQKPSEPPPAAAVAAAAAAGPGPAAEAGGGSSGGEGSQRVVIAASAAGKQVGAADDAAAAAANASGEGGGQQGATAALDDLSAGYNPKRNEFEPEYDNDAEMALAELEFKDNDSYDDRELKIKLLHMYNFRLDERARRKEFVLSRGFANLRRLMLTGQHLPAATASDGEAAGAAEKQSKTIATTASGGNELSSEIVEHSKASDSSIVAAAGDPAAAEADGPLARTAEEHQLLLRLRKYARFVSMEEYDELVRGVLEETRLWQQISVLQEARHRGCRTIAEAEGYFRHKSETAVTAAMEAATHGDDVAGGEATAAAAAATAAAAAAAAEGQLQCLRQLASDELKQPLDVESHPGVELLSREERELCKRNRLLPLHYAKAKEVLMRESIRLGGQPLSRDTARRLFRLSHAKVDNVYDFLTRSGWIAGEIEKQ